jgi:hypothetical protein
MSEETTKSGGGKGIIGFILGLVSLLLGWWIIGAIFAATFSAGAAALGLLVPVLGLVFSAMGMKSEKRGLAITGLILSIIGLIICALVTWGVFAAASIGGAALNAMETYGH